MFLGMFVLAIAGLVLLFAAPVISRVVLGKRRDGVALTRILQAIAIAMLVGALFLRPYNPETTAVPPPPDVPDARAP